MSKPNQNEHRADARKRVLKGGIIAYSARQVTLPCIVKDISSTGARLRIESRATVPDTFELLIELDGFEVACEVVWRAAQEVGVTFVAAPTLVAPKRVQVVNGPVEGYRPTVRRTVPGAKRPQPSTIDAAAAQNRAGDASMAQPKPAAATGGMPTAREASAAPMPPAGAATVVSPSPAAAAPAVPPPATPRPMQALAPAVAPPAPPQALPSPSRAAAPAAPAGTVSEPRPAQPDTVRPKPPAPAAASAATAAGRRPDSAAPILIAEDDPDDRLLLADAFAEASFSRPLQFVEDGLELLAYLREPSNPIPEIIIVDLNMPRLDGRQVLKALKEDPRWRRIPVLVLTTSVSSEDIEAVYGLGASAYIPKPGSFDDLVDLALTIDHHWLRFVARLHTLTA